jgi:16S rRNA (cytosine967-C5)-methyltransferase
VTPGARVQTAIELLDLVVEGEAAEAVLTRWARRARHAGSSDRAAIRDHVFDILRRWWSSAALGAGECGRARMIGYLRDTGADPSRLFTGEGYAPAPLTDEERAGPAPLDPLDRLDAPRWLLPELDRSLGRKRNAVLAALRERAPIFLRVNLARTSRDEAVAALEAQSIRCKIHPLSDSALLVETNPRRVQNSAAYRTGLVELQDAASQAVVDLLPLAGRRRILDFCAGGGGKTLAMAARHPATYHAHDADASRLRDLPTRAARAGAEIGLRSGEALRDEVPYDLVLVDAPCSGSGAWRRSPESKIRLTQERLDALLDLQARILDEALSHVTPGGRLAYITCSLLARENGDQVRAFVDRSPVTLETEHRFTPLEGGDGFYFALVRRD